MKLLKAKMVPYVVGAILLGVASLGMAQKASLSGTVSGGIGVDVSGLKKGDGEKTKAPKGMDLVEERTKAMQESIKKAVAQFQKANGSTNEKLARLDSVLNAIDNGLSELGENGPLYQDIAKAIKTSEDQKKKYVDKANDPKIEAKLREQYQKLADKISKNVNGLYENKIILSKQRTELEQRKTSLTQQKDFVVDLMTADDIEAANDALIQVIQSVQGVVKSIDDFAENMSSNAPAEDAGKATR
jgi:hypothetical protein